MGILQRLLGSNKPQVITTSIELTQMDKPSDELIQNFLQVWIATNVHNDYYAEDSLSDKHFIFYSAWEQLNSDWLYAEYLPHITLYSGSANRTDKIVFHGGCQPCVSQHIYGIDRCTGCQYFRANWKKENLCVEHSNFLEGKKKVNKVLELLK